MKTSDEEPDSASAMLEDSKPDGPKVPIIVKTSIMKRPLADLTFDKIMSDKRKRLEYLVLMERLRQLHGKVIITFENRNGRLALSKHKSKLSAGGW